MANQALATTDSIQQIAMAGSVLKSLDSLTVKHSQQACNINTQPQSMKDSFYLAEVYELFQCPSLQSVVAADAKLIKNIDSYTTVADYYWGMERAMNFGEQDLTNKKGAKAHITAAVNTWLKQFDSSKWTLNGQFSMDSVLAVETMANL